MPGVSKINDAAFRLAEARLESSRLHEEAHWRQEAAKDAERRLIEADDVLAEAVREQVEKAVELLTTGDFAEECHQAADEPQPDCEDIDCDLGEIQLMPRSSRIEIHLHGEIA